MLRLLVFLLVVGAESGVAYHFGCPIHSIVRIFAVDDGVCWCPPRMVRRRNGTPSVRCSRRMDGRLCLGNLCIGSRGTV